MDKRIHIDQIGQLVELKGDMSNEFLCKHCVYFSEPQCHRVSPLTDECDWGNAWVKVPTSST